MGHRVFNVVVVVFWVSTMSWLIVAKVLPPLRIGEPPSYRSVYAVNPEIQSQPVYWDMLWNDQPMGWAMTEVSQSPSGVTEVISLVHFTHVPLHELAPPLIRAALRGAVESIGSLAMDAQSRLEIDPLGRLSRIYSMLRPVGLPAEIVIRGQVEGNTLKGEVSSGAIRQSFERYLPPNALLGDELSPQARIPGLRIGQEWTVPVYSPLRFSDNRNPVEILHAKVEDQESVVIGDDSVLTLVVVYRSDSGSILGGANTPRGKMWVAEDGTVLKQTSRLFGSQLTFQRAAPDRAKQIHAESKVVGQRMEAYRRKSRWRRGPPPAQYIHGPAAADSGNHNGDADRKERAE